MLSDSDSPSVELALDPQSRCLALAERMISSINDPDFVNRYFAFKTKLFAGRAPPSSISLLPSDDVTTGQAYSFYESIVKENQKLREQVAALSSKKPDFKDSPDNESLAAQLRDLQKAILPTQTLPARSDAVAELESLRKVVDAKLDSLKFIRDKLRTQNQQLMKDFETIEGSLNSKIEAAHNREDSEQKALESREQKLEEEIARLDAELQEVSQNLEAATSENSALRQKHSETSAVIEKIQSDIAQKEREVEQMEAESESLYEELGRLKMEVSRKSKELNALQTLRKFGVEVSRDFEIAAEIQKLSEKADALRGENAEMAFELKRLERRKQTNSILESQEAATLDEDELAVQLLKAKWS
jgi:chromosome segregation ATPase